MAKHIIHLTPIYWDNWGYQENILTEYQAQEGHKVTVIAPAVSLASYRNDLNGAETRYAIGNVNIIRLNLKWNFLNRFYWFSNLYSVLSQEQPDIIMIHGLQMLPVFDVLKYKRKNMHCKLYGDFHSDYLISASNYISKLILHRLIWRSIIKYSLPFFETIYYTRPSVRAFVKDMYAIEDNILVELLMGAEFEQLSVSDRFEMRAKLRSSLSIPDSALVFCTGGKIDEKKKIDLIIDALRELNNPHIHLIVFGQISDDYASILQNISKDVKNIHVVGWVDNAEVYKYFISADISIFLGQHSVLWEQAIGCGSPTIFSYKGDREYLDLGGNLIFLYGDGKKELIQHINMLYNCPELIQQMKHNAIEKGPLKFSYRSIVSKLNKAWGL